MKKVVYSLFDGSGLMVQPWAEAGYECYCFNADSGDHGKYEMRVEHPNIHYINAWIEPGFDPANDRGCVTGIPKPGIIFAFPPCTLMAQSGSKHQRADDDITLAVEWAKVAMHLGNKYGCPWMVENPIGKLCTAWPKPSAYFHPFEYGAYMREEDEVFHPRMPKFDGYTKRTAIWHGNGFIMPDKEPGPINIGYFWAWRWTGGKSARTKQLRSLTPRGFARAVFADNGDILDCCEHGDCPDRIPF